MRGPNYSKSACVALAAAASLWLAGCSSFHREWRAALKDSAPASAGLAGAWEGRWVSKASGHSGRLRCLVTPAEGGGFDAFYHAKWKGILSGSYRIPLAAEAQPDGSIRFSGSADLGKLYGGVYRAQGVASGQSFHADYSSRYDQGVFQMTRKK